MTKFAEIVDAAGQLSLDEQQSLVQILQRRLVEERRRELRAEVDEARSQHQSGTATPTSVSDLINEILS